MTYRELAWNSLANIIRASEGSSNRSNEIELALRQFRVKFDAAVNAVPTVAKLLDQSEAEAETTDEIVDPINRADDIVAHIAEKLQDH